MSAAPAPVSDMTVTVKAREIQRATLAEMRGDRSRASRHFLAAAHLECVLADDYEQAGQTEMSLRSRISAASCLWRAGKQDEARQMFNDLIQNHPLQQAEIKRIITELEQDYPNQTSKCP
jgi:hypothetical protein